MERYRRGNMVVRDAIPADAEVMAGCLREANKLEILAGSGKEPLEVLRLSVEMSEWAATALFGDAIVAMGGIAPQKDPGRGIVWMLGSEEFAKARIDFCRVTKTFIRMFLERYPVLENYFDARHKDTLQWLLWLGAEIEPAKPFGVAGLPFHHFIFKR